jgi:hypothetical protein
MFLHVGRALLVSVALTALANSSASAQIRQTAGSKITVAECSAHQHPAGYPGHPWIDPYGGYHGVTNFPYTVGFLAIAYTNHATVAAKEVDFGLISRGSLIATAKDVGTFTPGVEIRHEFSVDPEIFPIGTALPYCAVLRITYADGTEWRNPNPPPL